MPDRDRVFPTKPKLPLYVHVRDGSVTARATGASFKCRLESCTGIRVTIRWPDGNYTHPCSKGMKIIDKNNWQLPG